jgi:TPR repeat protein
LTNNIIYINRVYYELGVGVYSDYSQALEWFSKSASKGYGPAENKLNVPSNKRMSMISRGIEEKLNKKQIDSNNGNGSGKKKYYEESVRIAERSRRTHAEQNCQIM